MLKIYFVFFSWIWRELVNLSRVESEINRDHNYHNRKFNILNHEMPVKISNWFIQALISNLINLNTSFSL